MSRRRLCAPSPLVGEGWGGVGWGLKLRRYEIPLTRIASPRRSDLSRKGRGENRASLSCNFQTATPGSSPGMMRTISRRAKAPEFKIPLIKRAQGMPGARLHPQPCVQIKKHTSVVTTGTSHHPTFPAQWCYGLLRGLPGEPLFYHRHYPKLLSRNLVPASRHQDHTTSPSARPSLVS